MESSRGFTLIEAIISMVIIAVVLVASLGMMGATTRSRRIHGALDVGPFLADTLLAEVAGHAFEDPQLPGGALGRDEPAELTGDRSTWDDVDDFDGFSAPPAWLDDTPVPGATGWTWSVTAGYASPTTAMPVSGPTDLKLITVTATSPSGDATVRSVLRSRFGAQEQPPTVDTSYVTWVGVEVQMNDETTPAAAGMTLVNHIPGSPE